jgi:hypothetical protein
VPSSALLHPLLFFYIYPPSTIVVFHYGSLHFAILLSKCYFEIEFLSVKKNWNFQQKNAFFTMVQRKYKLHPHLHLKVSIAQKDCQFFPARFQHCFASQIDIKIPLFSFSLIGFLTYSCLLFLFLLFTTYVLKNKSSSWITVNRQNLMFYFLFF